MKPFKFFREYDFSLTVESVNGNENGYSFQHAMNGGEFYIEELGYWLDGYDSINNIVIEYNEKHHRRQTVKDEKRKKEIIEFLKCKFIEIWD
jgi:hypothetical protein